MFKASLLFPSVKGQPTVCMCVYYSVCSGPWGHKELDTTKQQQQHDTEEKGREKIRENQHQEVEGYCPRLHSVLYICPHSSQWAIAVIGLSRFPSHASIRLFQSSCMHWSLKTLLFLDCNSQQYSVNTL